FVAGLVLNGTPLGHNAAERALPLRDAFAVLFFVSVGMLFDATILLREPLAVAGVLFIVMIGKSAAALAITHVFRLDRPTSFTVAAALAQIGEFSFILAALGMSLGVMSAGTNDLILAASLISIAMNPFVFALADRLGRTPPPDDQPGSADGPGPATVVGGVTSGPAPDRIVTPGSHRAAPAVCAAGRSDGARAGRRCSSRGSRSEVGRLRRRCGWRRGSAPP